MPKREVRTGFNRNSKDKDKGKTRGDRDKEREGMEKKVRFGEKIAEIDFRDVVLLRKFITQHGKIMPSRMTGVSAKQQRKIAAAIRRARVMGLMP